NTVTYNTEPDYTTDGMITTDWPSAGTWHTVDVTDFVEGWYISTFDNYGVYCHSIDTTRQGGAGYNSKDSADSLYWPVLYIHYTNTDVESESLGTIKGTFN
ncbi:MAG: DNRLRE domain-containing protein, partial [bacterium]|nr:DNRLRE domain-containing protein [bacterium]